jgi:uncharacterized membrane protein YeaQ/YmgE (transglycosylase-associated protein family)
LLTDPTAWARYKGHMYVFTCLLVGIILAVMAQFVIPAQVSGRFLWTALVGTAGGLVGGVVARSFGWYASPGHLPGIAASLLGAVLALSIHRSLMRPRSSA